MGKGNKKAAPLFLGCLMGTTLVLGSYIWFDDDLRTHLKKQISGVLDDFDKVIRVIDKVSDDIVDRKGSHKDKSKELEKQWAEVDRACNQQ